MRSESKFYLIKLILQKYCWYIIIYLYKYLQFVNKKHNKQISRIDYN